MWQISVCLVAACHERIVTEEWGELHHQHNDLQVPPVRRDQMGLGCRSRQTGFPAHPVNRNFTTRVDYCVLQRLIAICTWRICLTFATLIRWQISVDAMFGACLTDENSILNIRMQQFKNFRGTLAYHILGSARSVNRTEPTQNQACEQRKPWVYYS